MTELFYAVLKASFQGSIVILAVMLLRQLLKQAPRSVFCLLWLLAGLRLALPFEIESSLSLQPRLEESQISIQAQESVQLPAVTDPVQDVQISPVPEQTPTLPAGNWEDVQTEEIPYKVEDGVITEPLTWTDIAVPLWLLGVSAMLLASLISYLKLKRRLREAYLIENGCFECPGLETAFVLGFLPPRIYLPAGLSDREKAFIYDHENTHIARHDHWYKLLGYGVLALHWFNPLVWVGYSLLCRDIELACDEHVVRNMSLTERKAYSTALLSCGGQTARIAACPVAFGEANPKKRILNVLNYKRPTFWISLLAVIAVAFVAVCLLTSPGDQGLAALLDVGDFDAAYLASEDCIATISDPADIRQLKKLLGSLSADRSSPREIPEVGAGWNIQLQDILLENGLFLSADCTLVWADGTDAYPVSQPEKLLNYLEAATDAVRGKAVSGEAFASIEEPGKWLAGISAQAVRTAEIHWQSPTVQEGNKTSSSSTNGYLSAGKLDELLKILNSLPASALKEESTVRRQDFSSLQSYLAPYGGVAVTLHDDVNGLAVVLRLVENDTLELIFTNELDKVADGMLSLDDPRCWILESKALLALLQSWNETPPVLLPVTRHDRAPEWNLEMQVTNVTPSGLTVEFVQSGIFYGSDKAQLMFGTEYTLKRLENGQWVDVEMLPQENPVGWATVAYLIELNSTAAQGIDWEWLYGQLPAGHYRIGKGVTLDYTLDEDKHQTLYVEFDIVEENSQLQQCLNVLTEIQSRHAVHLLEQYTFSGEGLPENGVDRNYFRSGDTWLRIDTDGGDFAGYFYHENTDYFGNSENTEFIWQETDGQENMFPQPWLLTFDLRNANAEVISRQETRDGYALRLMVHEPVDMGWLSAEEYYVDFCFDTENHFLRATAHIAQNFSEMTAHMIFADMTWDDVADTIRQYTGVQVSEPVTGEEAVTLCREAMLRLKNSEALHFYVENLDDPSATYNIYMKTSGGWLFRYRRPLWDHEYVSWLRYGEEQYLYGGDVDENGIMTAPYYWQVEKDPQSHTFQLPYPFDLDWATIGLTYGGTEMEDDYWKTVTLQYPQYGAVFRFTFGPDDTLSWFDVSDTSGEPEATTTRFYVISTEEAEVEEELSALYQKAASTAGQKPGVPDDAFYEELFSRETDGADTTRWISDLYGAFYLDPAGFVSRLSVHDRAEDVLMFMKYEVNYYAPYRFDYVLSQLEQSGNPNVEIIQRMKALMDCDDPDCTDPDHDHYGIACTVEGCTNPDHHHDDHHEDDHH